MVYKEDWRKKFGLKRAFNKHLKAGDGMTIKEFVRCLHYCFSFCDTEKTRVQFWLVVGILLFFHAQECEDFDSHPFSRPLDDFLNELIQKNVDEAVAEALRAYEWELKQGDMER